MSINAEMIQDYLDWKMRLELYEPPTYSPEEYIEHLKMMNKIEVFDAAIEYIHSPEPTFKVLAGLLLEAWDE